MRELKGLVRLRSNPSKQAVRGNCFVCTTHSRIQCYKDASDMQTPIVSVLGQMTSRSKRTRRTERTRGRCVRSRGGVCGPSRTSRGRRLGAQERISKWSLLCATQAQCLSLSSFSLTAVNRLVALTAHAALTRRGTLTMQALTMRAAWVVQQLQVRHCATWRLRRGPSWCGKPVCLASAVRVGAITTAKTHWSLGPHRNTKGMRKGLPRKWRNTQ